MKKHLQLLICEDDSSDAAMIIRKLEKANYTVHHQRVETAADLLKALETESWDVVISDFHIPGFGGPAALSTLRSTGKDIPFILVSGAIGEETAVNMMRAGASDYLMKHSLTRLNEVVKRELEEAANRRERKAAAEQIKANEEKYRAVIDNSLFAIFLARPGGLIMESNKAATELFGYTAEEFLKIGREQLLDFSDKTLAQKVKERDAKGSSTGEFTGIKKNGERFDCEVSSVIFNDINGEQMSCAMLADISPRKNVEQKLKETNNELKELSHHLKNAREDERKYIAREVHDQLGQLATALKIDVDWLNMKIVPTDEMAKKRVAHATNTIDVLITSIRKIASSLRPSVLDDFGLNAAIEWQCTEFQNLNNIETVFTSTFDDKQITLEMKTELFRIVQESLTNVMRHSKAGYVEVMISEDAKNICLSIADNGKGFDTSHRKKTLGLIGLRERAESLNGKLNIESAVGKGTTVKAIIPKN